MRKNKSRRSGRVSSRMSSAEKMDLGLETDVDGLDWLDWICVMGGLESGGRGIGIGLSERDREREKRN